MATETQPGELMDRVGSLTERIEALGDVRARELANELVGAVIEMYGDGLARIMAALERSGDAGAEIRDELIADGAVASLLLIHDLYPVDLETRVIEALDTVRPYMESHGGNVEVLGIEEGVARLRLQGSCSGCAASQATLELAIKQALDEHCPDLAGLEVEGVAESPPAATGFELPVIRSNGAASATPNGDRFALPMSPAAPTPGWVPVDGAHPDPGTVRTVEVSGVALVMANVEGSLLAYRDRCAACGGALHDGELDGGMLSCPECGAQFDLPRAGRGAHRDGARGDALQLTPVPLLADGVIRVAV